MKVAMILAAGRGERLKQLTQTCPKALFMVREKPLIEHHLIGLAAAGFERVVINHAYLGGKIRQYLGDGQRFGLEICYSAEPPGGYETGGGVVNALPLLGKEPFAVVNADIYTDFDFKHLHEATPLHLVLVKKAPELGHRGDFGLLEGRVINHNQEYVFACIAVYHPEFFASYMPGRYSLTPFLRHQVAQGEVSASIHHGLWFDIGSLQRYQDCLHQLSLNETP
jgi:MurNAc alpha-1-phosphate uridylyltransferase